ncbi:MAG: capsule assembly Wzi family protein [Acidobacteriaceae bacterium]|nr:capsule assembly Wzi family protein [Acidobacteriaceae bacterium]
MSAFGHSLRRYARLCAFSGLPFVAATLAAAQAPATPPAPPVASVPTSSTTKEVPAPYLPGYASPKGQPVQNDVQQAPAQAAVPQPIPASTVPSVAPYAPLPPTTEDHLGSAYIPVDSPVYPMAMRLYSLGYLDTAFLAMRPWTRRSLLHMLQLTEPKVMSEQNEQAIEILAKLKEYLADEADRQENWGATYGVDKFYTRLSGINGLTLRDSYHLGQSQYNDYGRPYGEGFNNVTGFSTTNEWWRFSLHVRGEYQHAPSIPGYSYAVASQLSCNDYVTGCPMPATYVQDTIPYGNTGSQNNFRLQEAAISFHAAGHEISFGKTDAWMGPGYGGAMAWSNNAENIYSFRINRVEPMYIPLIKHVLGPLRYDFFVGSLKGHTSPNDPWVHAEMFEFQPSSNFQFGFERTVIWGGKGHSPITIHTFLKSFFDINDTTSAEKYSRNDPGARYSTFNFSYRLPFLRHSMTLYVDTIAHDDVTPISAPRRAAYRPGIYLSHVPGIPRLDLRVEATSTDTSTLRSQGGQFNYYEIVQLQGYTNKGFIMGDWVGREAKGGQAWLTYHLSGNEWVQMMYMTKQAPKDFISGGVTQSQIKGEVVKRLGHNLELDGWVQYERWKAPVYQSTNPGAAIPYTGTALYKPNQQNNFIVAAQFTWYPKLRKTGMDGKLR